MDGRERWERFCGRVRLSASLPIFDMLHIVMAKLRNHADMSKSQIPIFTNTMQNIWLYIYKDIYKNIYILMFVASISSLNTKCWKFH